jgi:hypothetical protein
MKIQFLTLLATLLLSSCSKDNPKDPIFALPPETQTGANTFGVTINGKVYIPRDPTGTITGPSSHGLIFTGSSTLPWSEIVVKDGKCAVGFQMIIHFKELLVNAIGIYPLFNSNFHDGIDSALIDHIYFKIWDANISDYAYYGSVENQGEIKVTRFNGSLTVNWILSGNFKGKFIRNDNPNDFITITDGRFDLNLNTLPNASFP